MSKTNSRMLGTSSVSSASSVLSASLESESESSSMRSVEGGGLVPEWHKGWESQFVELQR